MKATAIAILRQYKRWISPAFPPSCRYVPTCSEYAIEAIERHGVLRGGVMAAWRLLRCHPFVKGGYDPVEKNPTIAENAMSGAHGASTERNCRASLGWTAKVGRP
ncbi:MAG: membrane protein insertion efficiency factor YidD [Terriglobales bacterium]